jgi:hypothetical protein
MKKALTLVTCLVLLAATLASADQLTIRFTDGSSQEVPLMRSASDVLSVQFNRGGGQTSALPMVSPGTNLALRKPATQSSTSYGGTPERAVDGNTDGNHSGGSVSHTDLQSQAWWEVDLGAAYRIGSVRVFNRTDCCTDRLTKFYVLVSDTPFPLGAGLDAARMASGSWSFYVDSFGTPSIDVPVHRTGRYVRVQLTGANYLSLTEVQVLSE